VGSRSTQPPRSPNRHPFSWWKGLKGNGGSKRIGERERGRVVDRRDLVRVEAGGVGRLTGRAERTARQADLPAARREHGGERPRDLRIEQISVEFTHEVADGMHGAIIKAIKTLESDARGLPMVKAAASSGCC
jgi:hypothetical protein